jgi:hypothetical protein
MTKHHMLSRYTIYRRRPKDAGPLPSSPLKKPQIDLDVLSGCAILSPDCFSVGE